jgi:hypothetical protein
MGKCTSAVDGKENGQAGHQTLPSGVVHSTNNDLAQRFYARKKLSQNIPLEDISSLEKGEEIDDTGLERTHLNRRAS